MPKLMNQLVVSSTSESTISTGVVGGGGGGGGITYDVSVLATDHSSTSGYSNLSWSNVSTVQYGTFENGTATSATPRNSASATNVSRFTFDTAGIYVVEFVTYGQNAINGFAFIDVVRNGSTEVDEILGYQGIYASYNRKTCLGVRQFNPGDELTFFSNGPTSQGKLSRILIAKIG
jgi:hypothetical protein